MSKEEKLKVTKDLPDQLEEMHRIGTVHEGIKPHNALYANGKRKFLDFGLSNSSKSSAGFSGCICYIAPWQLNKRIGSSEARTEIWRMGVLLYERLACHIRFESYDAYDAINMILRGEPVPAHSKAWEMVWNVIEKIGQRGGGKI